MGAVLAAAMLLAACGRDADRLSRHRGGFRDRSPASQPTTSTSASGLILASSFEQPVCGRYHGPGQGCEFGVEGQVRTGTFGCRTGDSCIEIERQNYQAHMGVISVTPLPGGNAFVGSAQRVPAIPGGALPSGGYLQLEQISPTDGSTVPGWPVEVRMYADRRLGLALFNGSAVARTRWQAPVDRWFYIVLQVQNGVGATQRMWVYDENDHPVDQVSIRLDTRQQWAHGLRPADKIGGTNSTLVPMFTYADDWYIATTNEGPLHIGPDGQPLSA